VIERRATTALLRVTLSAGRHHQVRAHLAAAGHPIVGDGRYGVHEHEHEHVDVHEDRGETLHLHAESVRFKHPVSGETIFIEAPPPDWAKIRA